MRVRRERPHLPVLDPRPTPIQNHYSFRHHGLSLGGSPALCSSRTYVPSHPCSLLSTLSLVPSPSDEIG